MRYRYVQRRYAMTIARDPLRTLVGTWHTERLHLLAAPPLWQPSVDVYETSRDLLVTVELAGVEPDDLEVSLYENALVVAGERRLPPCDPDGVYHAVGIRRGAFRVAVPLTVPIVARGVDARQEQGVLRIRLRKA